VKSRTEAAEQQAASDWTGGEPLIRVVEDENGRDVIGVGVRTLDQLLSIAEVDGDSWNVVAHKCNSWPAHGGADNPPLVFFQTTARLEPKPGINSTELAQCVKRIVSQLGKIQKPSRAANDNADGLIEIALFDQHFGQANMGTLDEQAARILGTVQRIFNRAKAAAPTSRVLLVLGGDVAHCDSIRGETTSGTKLEDALPYAETYSALVALVLAVVRWLVKQGVDVSVLVVGGNHDYHLSLHLTELLKVAFAESEAVEVIGSADKFVRFRWGTCLLGFAHGDTGRPGDLPGFMSAEWPQDWGETTHREWHTGHQHRTAMLDKGGCRFRVLPALCSRNGWAMNQGHHMHQRGAEAYIWSKSLGYRGHLSETLGGG